MIRLLHFADVHLGVENYGKIDPQNGVSTRVMDFLRRLDEMIKYAETHSADLAIFAGDAFKNQQPNPTLQREFANRITDLARICPVILLVGNHDVPTMWQRASSIEIYETLQVPNVLVGSDYVLHEVHTKSGVVLVGTAPYPIRARLLGDEQLQGKSVQDLDQLMQRTLQTLFNALAREAEQSQYSDAPRVLAGHFTVQGAEYGSERAVMAGRDAVVPLSELAIPAWDYVALGHIHKHQNLTEGRKGQPPVVYSGSMERIDFGEEMDAKGFCWVELERGATRWQFVPTKSRPFATLRIDVRGIADPTGRIVEEIKIRDLAQAVVRVYIEADVESEAKLNERAIHIALEEAGVHHIAGISKDVERPARSRLGVSPEGLSSLQLLERYLKTKGIPQDRIDVLLQKAKEIIGTDSV
jgi:DNA repair protein SbcD/Mre11